MTVQAARDHIKPGTALFATGRGRYRLIDLTDSETESKDISLKEYRPHTFYPNTHFKELVKSFRKRWQKILKGYSAEVHIVLNEAKNRGRFQDLIDASPHLHPDIILRAMPTGTTILVPPQTNFSDMCWLMTPPPEKSQIPKEEFLILSHSERKLWQSTPEGVKKWATDEYGRAAPWYWDKKLKLWDRSPKPSKKWVLDSQGKPLLLKFNKMTKEYESRKKKGGDDAST